MKLLLAVFLLVLVGAVGLVAAVWAFQERLLYFPEPVPAAAPGDYDLVAEDVFDDRGTWQGWFLPTGTAEAITLVYFHGNGGNVSHLLPMARQWVTDGFDVLLVEYDGYGARPGQPDEATTYRNADTAWRFLTGPRGRPAHRVVLWGHSLGGGVASELASRVDPGLLVLDSTFTSAVDRGAEVYPFLPVRWLMRNRYDTLGRLDGLRCPVLVAHSRTDEVIPFAHGERLFAAAREPKRFIGLHGGHNTSDGADTLPVAIRAALPGAGGSAAQPEGAPLP